MDKPIVGIAVIAALAAGIYAYMLHGELTQQKAAVVAAEQNLNQFKRATDDANRKSAVAKAALDLCNTQLADAQTKADDAAKACARPRAKH